MWKKRKLLILAVLAATVLLVGGVGGVVYAQTGSDNTTTPGKSLLARVATILGIDQQRVEDAFAQAREEMQNEALDNRLKSLVEQDRITQEQADQYKEWLQSKPDMSQYRQQFREWQQARPGIPDELKDWQEDRPDVPLPGGFGARGFRGGMQMGRGLCLPGW